MTKIRTILVDDERKSLAILKNKLDRYCPEIKVIAQLQDPTKAVDAIIESEPDLVFLDIAMPVMSGFDVLNKIPNPSFDVIFATAFNEYALDAIKHSALDYLVKPVGSDELIKAVARAKVSIEEKTSKEKIGVLIENLSYQTFKKNKIVIPTQEGLDFIKIEDIIYCEGVDGYTRLYFDKRKSILSSKSIGYFKDLLQKQDFYLVHKSYLINLNHIEKYLVEGTVVLKGGVAVSVSRSRRADFVNVLRNAG